MLLVAPAAATANLAAGPVSVPHPRGQFGVMHGVLLISVLLLLLLLLHMSWCLLLQPSHACCLADRRVLCAR
jgi:hypothetical protein